MVVKVHPKDFVSVPRDYDCAKARVCRYEVIAEMPREKASTYLRDRFVYEPEFNDGYRAGELATDLEVGEFYRTRDGRVAEVQTYIETEDTYPYAGRIVGGDGAILTWTYDGVYQVMTDEEDLDLIDWVHPDDVDLDAEQSAPEPRRRHWFTRMILGDN
jgi:hypothetical protein